MKKLPIQNKVFNINYYYYLFQLLENPNEIIILTCWSFFWNCWLDELPRLPVPDLKATCTKYLNSVEPLLTSEEFQNTKNAVEEFLKPGGDGEKLQAKLIERSLSSVPSWLEEWWDDSYLYGRDPISINVNYFFGFEDDPDPQKNNQIGKAASLLYGAIIFRNLIRE